MIKHFQFFTRRWYWNQTQLPIYNLIHILSLDELFHHKISDISVIVFKNKVIRELSSFHDIVNLFISLAVNNLFYLLSFRDISTDKMMLTHIQFMNKHTRWNAQLSINLLNKYQNLISRILKSNYSYSSAYKLGFRHT